jgi:hypothetical protein
MAFDFRATAPHVVDPVFGVPVLFEVFPHTYVNGKGDSVSAGWLAQPDGWADRSPLNDPRIAGFNSFNNNGTGGTFRVTLPIAATYLIDLAFGDPVADHLTDFKLFDNVTLVLDGSNAGAGFPTPVGRFIDATLASVVASTNWTGTRISQSFASTTLNLAVGGDNIGSFTPLAHLRISALEPPYLASRSLSQQLAIINRWYADAVPALIITGPQAADAQPPVTSPLVAVRQAFLTSMMSIVNMWYADAVKPPAQRQTPIRGETPPVITNSNRGRRRKFWYRIGG